MEPGPDSLDPVLLSQVRLGIVSVLMARDEAAFADLKDLLGATQGNLGTHLDRLEREGYVEVSKEFVRRRPRTTCRITPKGRAAFLRQLAWLESVARRRSGG